MNRTLLSSQTYGLCCLAHENQETYSLYRDVCDIASNVDFQRELRNVSRAVCRLACSEVYDKECSGFLYSRRERRCTLSPYTGEWIPTSAAANCTTLGLEFYRRSRLLGKIVAWAYLARLNLVWRGDTISKALDFPSRERRFDISTLAGRLCVVSLDKLFTLACFSHQAV